MNLIKISGGHYEDFEEVNVCVTSEEPSTIVSKIQSCILEFNKSSNEEDLDYLFNLNPSAFEDYKGICSCCDLFMGDNVTVKAIEIPCI